MSSNEGDKVIRSKLAREMDSGVSLVNIGHCDCGTRGEAVGNKLINIIRRHDS